MFPNNISGLEYSGVRMFDQVSSKPSTTVTALSAALNTYDEGMYGSVANST